MSGCRVLAEGHAAGTARLPAEQVPISRTKAGSKLPRDRAETEGMDMQSQWYNTEDDNLVSQCQIEPVHAHAFLMANLLTLPAEIRNAIFSHVFRGGANGLRTKSTGHVLLDETYSSKDELECLLTCRQVYNEAKLLAFHHTDFVIKNLFIDIPDRLTRLPPAQLRSLRSLAFVADARHFSKLHAHYWDGHPFGIPELELDILTIILHRSSAWHYLFDYTSNLVQVLRTLQGVKRIVFVRNQGHVKGSFKTWYNRLVGLMLKVDHHQRYLVSPPEPESTWWTWSLDNAAQTFCLVARPAKPLMDETTYIEGVLPLVVSLKESIESEEPNLDPRSWNGT